MVRSWEKEYPIDWGDNPKSTHPTQTEMLQRLREHQQRLAALGPQLSPRELEDLARYYDPNGFDQFNTSAAPKRSPRPPKPKAPSTEQQIASQKPYGAREINL